MSHPDALVEVLEEDPVPGRPLGRLLVEHDPRSRNFPMAAKLDPDAPLRSRHWCRTAGPFDQGSTSSCVGQAVAGVLHTRPFGTHLHRKVLAKVDPYRIYHLAQRFDPWPGTNYDGTSTLGGFKAARYFDFIFVYRWCFGLDDVLRTLSQVGAVVIGIPWYSSFDNPGPSGLLEIKTGATIRGGHAIEASEIDVESRTVVGPNSWGTSWGDGGYWRMGWDTLGRCLSEQGEAVTAWIPTAGESPTPKSWPDAA